MLLFVFRHLKLTELGKKSLGILSNTELFVSANMALFMDFFACLFVLRMSLIVSAEFLEKAFLAMLCSLCWLCSNRTQRSSGPTLWSGLLDLRTWRPHQHRCFNELNGICPRALSYSLQYRKKLTCFGLSKTIWINSAFVLCKFSY